MYRSMCPTLVSVYLVSKSQVGVGYVLLVAVVIIANYTQHIAITVVM